MKQKFMHKGITHAALLLLLLLLLGVTTRAMAEDTRTVISTVELTMDPADLKSIAVFGASCSTKPTFTVTAGAPAHLSTTEYWWYDDETQYGQFNPSTFAEGRHKFWIWVKIDGEDAKTHCLDKNVVVKVNGVVWESNGNAVVIAEDYSEAGVKSPDIMVAPAELTFALPTTANIGTSLKDKPITSFSIAAYAAGGVKPYTFSKVSGPDWLSVSSDGVVSGTPTTTGTNTDLVIRVTDSKGNAKDATLTVANTKQPISLVELESSDIATIPVYGGECSAPSFTVKTGSPADVHTGDGDGHHWFKKNGDTWTKKNYSDKFETGIYQYVNVVYIKEDIDYQLVDEIVVKVNGTAWTTQDFRVNSDGYSSVWIYSPEVEIGDPLKFVKPDGLSIDGGAKGTTLTSFSVASYASGGKTPYTFSKVSGPSWIDVAADGTVSGTRTVGGKNADLVVRVTDSNSESLDITIPVGKTTVTPAERDVVSAIALTSTDLSTIPVIGNQCKRPTFTVTTGAPAYVVTTGIGDWHKKEGNTDNWPQQKDGTDTFTKGIYRLIMQVRIDGEGGETHRLASEGLSVKVNGEEWAQSHLTITDTDSYVILTSPDIELGNPLKFEKPADLAIGETKKMEMIDAFSVSSYAKGGVTPYTFSKVSGPDWLSVSDGGTISGKPTVAGSNADLVVRVTDKEGDHLDITIPVGKTITTPATRDIVSAVELTSTDYTNFPVYGGECKEPVLTVTAGAPTRVYGNSRWQKKEGSEWVEQEITNTFTAGTYRLRMQLTIDGEAGQAWRLAADVTVKVNGVAWSATPANVQDAASSVEAYSPNVVVRAPISEALSFAVPSAKNVGQNKRGVAIESFSVAGYAAGGATPYTFSKVSGPDWLSVSSDGTVSGTPAAVGENDDLVIRVTDLNGDTKDATLSVAATILNPADREKISTLVLTSADYSTIAAFGNTCKRPTLVAAAGVPVYFPQNNIDWLLKGDGDTWVQQVESNAFIEGTYRLRAQVRIDGEAGKTHQLAEGLTVTVNGETWTVGNIDIYDEYSFATITSPDIVIAAPAGTSLTFSVPTTLAIGESKRGVAIESFSVAPYVAGGTAPYVFSKVSGPDWLSVSNEGLISGTPLTRGENDNLVIRVTDVAADYQEATISVGVTKLDPADREKVTTITLTSAGFAAIAAVGAECVKPTFTLTAGAPARVSASQGYWALKDGSTWRQQQTTDKFKRGYYRYTTELIIDGEDNEAYQFAKELTVTVNGESWTVSPVEQKSGYASVSISSPEQEVGTPLKFVKPDELAIGETKKGEAITSFSVASYASGGTTPYTFSKTSGPDWINVAADGSVSGTPDTAGKNADLVVRVTDSDDDYLEMTISVGKTIVAPADRNVISTIEITSDNYAAIAVFGQVCKLPEMTLTVGAPASVRDDIYWRRDDGSTYWEVQKPTATFIEGTYRLEVQVRIDGEEGTTHQLAKEGLTAKVNGQAWTVGDVTVTDTYSYAWIISPEIKVTDPTGIHTITADGEDVVRYNLRGQRVTDSYKGIVIINGKKTVVK